MHSPDPPETTRDTSRPVRKIIGELAMAIAVAVIVGAGGQVFERLQVPPGQPVVLALVLAATLVGTNSKNRKRLIVAGVLAMLAGLAFGAWYANQRAPECDNRLTDVLVVTSEVAQGAPITEDNLSSLEVPTMYVIDAYLLDESDAVGRIATLRIPAWSVLTRDMLRARSTDLP